MPRRIDVELTSARDDGTWTWRAAGAKQPKGVVESSLLYPGAKVGDVVTAEADFDIEGITITSITPPKQKGGRSDLLELTGSGDEFQPVITNWRERPGGRDRDPYGERAPRGDRPGGGGGGGGGGGRGGDRGGGRGPRPTADWRARATPPAPERSSSDRGGRRDGRGGGAGGSGAGRDRDRDRNRGPREDAGVSAGGPPPDRRGGARPPREGGGGPPRRDRDRPANRGAPAGAGEGAGRPRPKRLNPANTHRAAVVESLSPEQRPVAEQVLRGGIPAVRRAIEEQNTAAKAAGQPEIKPGPLVAMAEELLPRLKAAEWRDRAEAAMADVDEIGLRDLRSVVSGADAAARDEESRTLAASLREALDRRVKKQQDDWIGEITSALDENRLVRALRVSSRPPDPSMRVSADLALRLSGTASEAMASDTPPDRWVALLEAVAASPVRTTVKPAALPENPGEALLNAARQQAGRIPALTTLLGISMPPPPGPMRRIPPKPQQARGGAGGPKPPPPPPRPPAAAQPASATTAPPASSSAPEAAPRPDAPTESPASESTPAAAAPAPTPSAAPTPAAETEAEPAPPTPVHDESPSPAPTPPEAEAPVEPAATATTSEDVSVTADDDGPGAGEG